MKINYKFNLLIIGLLVTLTVLVAGSVNLRMGQILAEEMRDNKLTLAVHLAEDLANPLLDENDLRVQEIINDLKRQNADVRYVYVVGFEGTVVAHTFSSGFPIEFVTANPIPSGEDSAIQILSAGGESIQDVGARVLEGMDAKVYIGFSRAHLLECLARTTNLIIGITSLILLFGIVLTFFLTRTLTKPIGALVEGTKRVAGGDLDFRIDAVSRDEIGTLTESFNQMTVERKRAEEHIEHLNSVLFAIRNVNQLIVTEKDRDRLLRKACDALIEARGYDAAWLGLLSDGETFATVKGSGSREDVSRFCEHVLGGDLPPCIRNALARKEMVVSLDRSRECGDCFFKSACRGKEAAIIRVQHTDRPFGLLVILFAPDVVADEEEKELLKEVASDIALALHNMELEEARKQAEEHLKASLKEKEILLLEIHHRVKNNLQVVSSLLNMQARAAKDETTIDVLTESRDRINAMALIHTQLYDSGNLSEINMKRFVDNMVRQMFQSYPVRDTKITPVVHVADCTLPISIAVPLGLVVNELLSNAFKHAFVNRKEGKIEVSLSASKEGVVSLTVSDDGVGLPEGFDVNTTKTLGLHVVKILVEDQLQGTLEVVSDKGTTFKVEFQIEDNGAS